MRDKAFTSGITRRNFFKIGSTALAGSAASLCSGPEKEGSIKKFRKLGSTGFKASDISFGGTTTKSDVIRYAYDKGITYFDTAEGYSNGATQRAFGEVMQFMDRKKIWITTKLHIKLEETEENILKRIRTCLADLKTEYVDALYIHA